MIKAERERAKRKAEEEKRARHDCAEGGDSAGSGRKELQDVQEQTTQGRQTFAGRKGRTYGWGEALVEEQHQKTDSLRQL